MAEGGHMLWQLQDGGQMPKCTAQNFIGSEQTCQISTLHPKSRHSL